VIVESRDVPHETIVDEIIEALHSRIASGDAGANENAP
jgi:hypothetical protein